MRIDNKYIKKISGDLKIHPDYFNIEPEEIKNRVKHELLSMLCKEAEKYAIISIEDNGDVIEYHCEIHIIDKKQMEVDKQK